MYDAACVFVCVGGLEEGFECVWDACVSVCCCASVCCVCECFVYNKNKITISKSRTHTHTHWRHLLRVYVCVLKTKRQILRCQ